MSSYRMKYKIGLVEHSVVVPEDISAIPLGTILPYSANTLNPPAGFLFCDGSAISRSMYPDLFTLIGTLYGSGDGSTTFNLPNLIGKFPEGASSAGTVIGAGLPNITGIVNTTVASTDGDTKSLKHYGTGAFTPSETKVALWQFAKQSTSGSSQYSTNLEFSASSSNQIYGNSDTVQPPSLTVRYIIKAFHTVSNESAILDVSNITSDIATRLQRQQIPAFNTFIKITTSGNWTVPYNGWYKIVLKGGGGGGAAGKFASTTTFYSGGGGGGEGGRSLIYKYLEKDTVLTFSIGAGGAGAAKPTEANQNTYGSNGGNTTVTIDGVTYIGYGGGGASYYIGGSGGNGNYIPGISGTYAIALPYTSSSCGSFAGTGGGFNGYGKGGNGGAGDKSVAGCSPGHVGTQGVVYIEYFDPSL